MSFIKTTTGRQAGPQNWAIGLLKRPLTYALLATLAMCTIFLVLLLLAAGISSAPVESRVRDAFAKGELKDEDWLHNDIKRGNNQYNDCMVLHLIVNPAKSPLQKAVAPIGLNSDQDRTESCRALRQVVETGSRSGLLELAYSRYWHGYVIPTTIILRLIDVSETRQFLRAATCMLLLLLVYYTVAIGGLAKLFGSSVGLVGLLFWGLPYYGQGLSFAPGNSAIILGLVLLFVLRRYLVKPSVLACFSALFGAVIAFLEFLTGQIPTAAGLLFVAAYLIAFSQEQQGNGNQIFRSWWLASRALLYFALGVTVTLIAKQLLNAVVLGVDDAGSNLAHLVKYSGITDGVTYRAAARRLFRLTTTLTYGSESLARMLQLGTLCAWITAAAFAWRARRSSTWSHFGAHVTGAMAIPVWVLMMPGHTHIHAGFMSRILMVPVALGLSILLVCVLRPKTPDPAFSTDARTSSDPTAAPSHSLPSHN